MTPVTRAPDNTHRDEVTLLVARQARFARLMSSVSWWLRALSSTIAIRTSSR